MLTTNTAIPSTIPLHLSTLHNTFGVQGLEMSNQSLKYIELESNREGKNNTEKLRPSSKIFNEFTQHIYIDVQTFRSCKETPERRYSIIKTNKRLSLQCLFVEEADKNTDVNIDHRGR